MKKVLSWLLIMVFLCSFCCVQAMADGENEICGTYTLLDMDDGSGKDMSQVLPMMAAMGMSATLEIQENGTAKLDLFGEQEEFVVDFEKMVALADETEIPLTYEDGTLVLAAEGMSMTFTKGEPETPKGQGSFDYYELESYVDKKGKDLNKEVLAATGSDQVPSLMIFEAGDAVLDFYGASLDLDFDFDKNVFIVEEEEIPFDLKDDVLSFQDADGSALSFRLADPGFEGPYIMTALISEEEGDLTETLATLKALGMSPVLTIDKEGKATLDMFDEDTDMVFDFETMTVCDEEDSEEIPFTYENGVIVMEQDDNSMTFKRVMQVPQSLAELAGAFSN